VEPARRAPERQSSQADSVVTAASQLRTHVGLLAEEYDPESKRLVGNFPQAFSHVALINTAWNLSRSPGPADIRPKS